MSQAKEAHLRSETLVILLHGFGDDHSTFTNTKRYLDKEGFLTYAPDLPGFGSSNLPPLAPSNMANELVSAINNAYGNKCNLHLVGHSLGGMVALFMAEAGNFEVQSIVLIEGTACKQDQEFFESLAPPEPGQSKYSEFLKYIEGRVDIALAYQRYVDVLRRLKSNTFDVVVQGVITDFSRLNHFMGKIETPIAYCYGDKSRGGQTGKEFAIKMGWETHFYQDATHWLHEDSFDRFSVFLCDWLTT